MMKPCLAFVLAITLLCGCGLSVPKEPTESISTNIPTETHTVKFDYTFAGQNFPIYFIWSEIDGNIHVSKPETEQNSEDAWRWSVYGTTEVVKIYLHLETYNIAYIILYDVYEDTILDVLAGVPEEQKMSINDVLLAEDLSSAIIHCNKSENVYFYNISEEKLVQLEELTGVDRQAFAVYLENDLLLVNSRQGIDNRDYTAEVYIYDLDTGKIRTVVERMPLYSANYQRSGLQLRGAENPWIYEGDKVYEVDLMTGERHIIEE